MKSQLNPQCFPTCLVQGGPIPDLIGREFHYSYSHFPYITLFIPNARTSGYKALLMQEKNILPLLPLEDDPLPPAQPLLAEQKSKKVFYITFPPIFTSLEGAATAIQAQTKELAHYKAQYHFGASYFLSPKLPEGKKELLNFHDALHLFNSQKGDFFHGS